MYGSTAKAISHYKDKQKFIETPNFGGKLFCCTSIVVSKKHYLCTRKNRLTMKIETFTEEDIREAAHLAYPVWGEGHAANGQGEEFGLLMCEYIIR